MKEAIEKLINLLDEKEDFFLIGLLEIKISGIHVARAKLSKLDIDSARNGIRRIIRKELSAENKQKFDRINKIIDSAECSECKLSKRRLHSGLYGKNIFRQSPDSENLVCASCMRRVTVLYNYMEEKGKNIEEKLEIIDTDHRDLIELKALINKFQNKLYTFKRS